MLAAATIAAAVLLAFVVIGAHHRGLDVPVPAQGAGDRAGLHQGQPGPRPGGRANKDRLDLGKSYQSEGAALQRSGLIGQRFGSLERLGQAAPLLRQHPDGRALLPDLRDQAITAMGLTDLHLIDRREIGPMVAVAFDPSLERYATMELQAKESVGGQAVVRSMADDRELFQIPRPQQDFQWAWLISTPTAGICLPATCWRRIGSFPTSGTSAVGSGYSASDPTA